MRQRILLLCIGVVSYLYCTAQPNNNCSNAIAITALDGTCASFDNTNATEDIGPGACTAGANENVWFKFVADGVSAQIIVTNSIGNSEVTLVEFPNSPCNAADATEIACSGGTPLVVDNQLTIGQTYWVMVAFTNNADGLFDLCIENPEPAPNDACITATPISNLDNSCTTSNNDFPSTDLLLGTCWSGNTYNTWFSFVAQGVSLNANIAPGGPGIPQFEIIDFTTPCNSNQAFSLGCATGNTHVVLDNQLTIGQVYFVMVGFQTVDYGGTGIGDFELCLDNPVPAQNDDCDMAISIPTNVLNDPTTCFTSIGGNPLNNDFPSTDIIAPACWNAGATYNIWYSFVAQGPDVYIEVDPVFNQDAQIALVQFTGTPCQPAGAQILDCANGTNLDYNDQLIPGQTYYIAVGFENNGIGDFCMTVFNPVPPANDEPCDAQVIPTNGNCINGTTIYANPENFNMPAECQSAFENVVWYSVSMSDPDNVGFIVDFSLDDFNPNSTVSIVLFEVPDCSNIPHPTFFHCGDPPTEPIQWGPVDETATYYIMVGTSEANESDFEICVDEMPPCFTNDICEEATVIPDVQSDQPFVCVDGCNLFADPETFNFGCNESTFSVVWFQIPTDGNATLLNINVQSDDFDAPTITLFHQITDCSNLANVGLTQSNFSCIVGSQGEVEALGTDVGANEIYYLAVGSLNDVGGNFTLCVNTISQASACVTSSNIEITSRTGNGPLTGPFFPGETVSVCMNVVSYTAADNGCQWFQGMIPLFGNGWDPSSFDANGQPLNATVNGNPIGAAGNGLYGASTWDWFGDIGYHHNNVFFQIGDLDGNGTVEMCNTLYDVDCPDLGGITGGCCGPCWDDPGQILPPGWFAYGINGSCPTPGHPGVDWGDGNSCGGGMGPWAFCFDLNVREYPDCLDEGSTLSLGFFTTADGETGSWTGGPSVCALDQPLSITVPMCCSELVEEEEMLDPICSDQSFTYSISADGVDYWTWSFDGGVSVTGGTSGEGGPGSLVINTLVNNGDFEEEGEYTFLGFAGGACPVYRKIVTVLVYPKIQVTLDPQVLCATPTTPYIITPNVTGGSGNYEYLWSPGGENTASISIANPVNGTTYQVTVNDEIGCFGTAVMSISVYTTFPVDIDAPIVEQCIQLGPIDLDASASGGMDPYAYEWTYPGGTVNGDHITSDQSGLHLVIVTDDEGCSGRDSVMLTLNETPEVSIDAVNGETAICPGSSTQLTGVGSGGETPYIYEWNTPEGPESGKTIIAPTPGFYTVTIIDANECTNTFEIEILAQEQPFPDLGPDIRVCDFEEFVELSTTELFEDYQWSIGPAGDGLPTIEVNQANTYTVTVTNEFGCTGETSIEVSLFPSLNFNMPDTFEICPGNCILIDADDYGGPWENFLWDPCSSCINQYNACSEVDGEVIVYDLNGCSAVQEFAVVETTTLSANVQGPNVICTGNSITISAAPGFATYDWAPNGQITPSIIVTTPGTYKVTVEDVDGCQGIDSITVTSGDFVASINGPSAICAGVQATLKASPGFTSYLWSNGSTKDSIHVDDGTYSVTVTNSSGCTSAANITVIETPFVPQITGDDMICQTSEISTLNAGGPYASYAWSANAGGATTQTVDVSAAGTYTVTITDLSTCIGTASFTVGNHPVPFVAITGNPDFCVGGNTQMTATSGFTNYLWNTSDPTETITVTAGGVYTVTITDANGCTNTANTTVNPPVQETTTIIGSPTFCPGDKATLEVPSGYVSVLWSTGETTDQIQTSFVGTITVNVVDPNGCTASASVLTSSSSVLTPTITGDTAICDAGVAVLNAGVFDIYQWSGGLGTNQMASVNTPGIYSVTVSTFSGCMGVDSFEVSGYTTPTAVVTSTTSACDKQEAGGPTTKVNLDALVTAGDMNGTWAQVSGPAAVNISNPANVNFDGLDIGDYAFTYTTKSAVLPCVDQTYDLVISVVSCACEPVALGLAPDLCNDLGTIDLGGLITQGTNTTGVWTVISKPPGSTNPAFIANGSDVFDASSGDPGIYIVEYVVSGLPGYCNNSAQVTIVVLPTPVAGTAAAPLQFCAGENQNVTLSTLLIGADGGGQWVETSQYPSTGGAFNSATGKFNIVSQVPGIYTFDYIVNGGGGPCPDDQVTVQVEIEANPTADAGSPATLDCNNTSTQLGGSGSSVGPDFSYSWIATNGGTLLNPNQSNPTATSAGTYTLTVMNNLTGCSATDQVVIDQIGTFPTDIVLSVHSPDCAGDPPGGAKVTAVVGGVAPYTYKLNNDAPVTNPDFNNLTPGHYDIEITDATGCKLSDSFTIYPQVDLSLSILNYVHDTLIFAFGDTIKFPYLYSGSSSIPDSLVWKMGDSVICTNCPILEFVADLAGQITLEAYDIRGCKITKSVTYQVVRIRDVYIPNVFSPNEDGINDKWTLFSDADIEEISLMEVFTRWGDLVFRKEKFDPNDPDLGWDGTFNGDELNPGVYVYRIDILYGDGLRDQLAGDITIVK